jgi:hypothetical protein
MNGPGDESNRFSLVLRLDWNKGMPIPAAVDKTFSDCYRLSGKPCQPMPDAESSNQLHRSALRPFCHWKLLKEVLPVALLVARRTLLRQCYGLTLDFKGTDREPQNLWKEHNFCGQSPRIPLNG